MSEKGVDARRTERIGRRRYLLAGAGTIAASASGCLGVLDDGGGDGDDDGSEDEDGATTQEDEPPIDASALGSYRQFQYDGSNTGVSQTERLGDDPTRKWSFRRAERGPGYDIGSPAVADGTVYVAEGTTAGDSRVTGYAVDPTDGTASWETVLAEGTNVAGGAAVAEGLVLFEANGLVAHDPASGERRWRFDADDQSVEGPIAVADGAAYVVLRGYSESVLVSVDLADGSRRWETEVSTGSTATRVGVAEGTVYVGGGTLRAVDAATGEPQWRESLEHDLGTAPTVRGDRVYAAGGQGSVTALSRDGTVQWTTTVEGSGGGIGDTFPVRGSPVVADDGLYVAYDGQVTALDVAGETRWATEARTGNPIVVAGDTVYVSDLNSITGVARSDGERLWVRRTQASGGRPVTPAAVGEAVFFPSGGLVAYTA